MRPEPLCGFGERKAEVMAFHAQLGDVGLPCRHITTRLPPVPTHQDFQMWRDVGSDGPSPSTPPRPLAPPRRASQPIISDERLPPSTRQASARPLRHPGADTTGESRGNRGAQAVMGSCPGASCGRQAQGSNRKEGPAHGCRSRPPEDSRPARALQ